MHRFAAAASTAHLRSALALRSPIRRLPTEKKRPCPHQESTAPFLSRSRSLLFLSAWLQSGLELIAQDIAHRGLLGTLAHVLIVVGALFRATQLADRQTDATFLRLDREDLGANLVAGLENVSRL